MTELTLSQKKKLVARGKKLDSLRVRYEAEKKLGKDFRKTLEDNFAVSNVAISRALNGTLPSLLFRINEYIKSLN